MAPNATHFDYICNKCSRKQCECEEQILQQLEQQLQELREETQRLEYVLEARKRRQKVIRYLRNIVNAICLVLNAGNLTLAFLKYYSNQDQ